MIAFNFRITKTNIFAEFQHFETFARTYVSQPFLFKWNHYAWYGYCPQNIEFQYFYTEHPVNP